MGKQKKVFNINKPAGYLEFPESMVFNLVRKGRIPIRKMGRCWHFHEETIDSFRENRTQVAILRI